MQRAQVPGGMTCQRRPLEIDALADVNRAAALDVGEGTVGNNATDALANGNGCHV